MQVPELPIVMMSGFSQESVTDEFVTRPTVTFLKKPFRSQGLYSGLLDGHRQSHGVTVARGTVGGRLCGRTNAVRTNAVRTAGKLCGG